MTDSGGHELDKPPEINAALAQHLEILFRDVDKGTDDINIGYNSLGSFYLMPVTEEEVYRIILSLPQASTAFYLST